MSRGFKTRKTLRKSQKNSIKLRELSNIDSDTFHWLDYWVTVTLGLILVLIYVLGDIIFPGNLFIRSSEEITTLFAQNNRSILVLGEWYRIITSIFVHADIIHLGGNLLFLFIFGIRMEEMKHGSMAVAIIFLFSGIMGGLLTVISFELLGVLPNVSSLGASGGVQGLLAGNVVFLRRQYARGPLSALLIMGAFFLMTIGANTNFIAHLGGLIGGAIAALVLEDYMTR